MIFVQGKKTQKDRLTLMVCSNATGTSKVPLCVIGKSKNPRCFKNKNLNGLNVRYLSQRNAWMDRETFQIWLETIFYPHVLKVHGPDKKILLILDNAPGHFGKINLILNSILLILL